MMCLFHFVTKYGVLRKVVDNDAVKMVMNILMSIRCCAISDRELVIFMEHV